MSGDCKRRRKAKAEAEATAEAGAETAKMIAHGEKSEKIILLLEAQRADDSTEGPTSLPNETKRDERAFLAHNFSATIFPKCSETIVHLGERFLREGATFPRRMSMRACVRATSSLAHVETPLR